VNINGLQMIRVGSPREAPFIVAVPMNIDDLR